MSQGQNRTTERREDDTIGAEWLSICEVEYHKEKSFPKFFETMTGFTAKNLCFIPLSSVIHSLTIGGRFPLAPPKRGEGGAKRRVRGSYLSGKIHVSSRLHAFRRGKLCPSVAKLTA
jgi:hypothetical protein